MDKSKNKEYLSVFGKRVADRRKELGMSQDEVATLMGYKGRSSINKVELGLSALKQTQIAQLAKILDVPIDYLMVWEKTDSKKMYSITAEEYQIIKAFRQANEKEKQMVLLALDSYLEQKGDTDSVESLLTATAG